MPETFGKLVYCGSHREAVSWDSVKGEKLGEKNSSENQSI